MWTYNSSHYLSVGQDEINRDFAIKKAYDDQEEKFNYLRLKNLSLRSQGQAQFEIPPRSIRDYDYNKNLLIFADTLKKYPQIKPLLEGYEILLKRNFQCAMDMHKGNIMQRQNGELVLIDPLWYGSNPYADADRQRRMETDSMDQQEEEPEMIRGGQLPRKPKKAKVPIRAKLLDKETPF
jgi:hypothetical protein